MAAEPAPISTKKYAPKLVAKPSFQLSGTIVAPGDKSVSHRALLFGAMATGITNVDGLLEGEDILAMAGVLRALGADIQRIKPGQWQITGVGQDGFQSPSAPLDFGNAGTAVRLVMGLLAGRDITAELIGDESLSKRPMKRVLEPLRKIGATYTSTDGHLPVVLHGTDHPRALHHKLDVASAQVKSAILLAGCRADGQTSIEEPGPSRDHTESMLRAFGVPVHSKTLPNGGGRITLDGPVQLSPCSISVPGDPSSAAFAIIAALCIANSDITVENVMINPTRNGLIETAQEAGYDIRLHNQRQSGGEQIADVQIIAGCKSPLRPPAARAVRMIDEYPVLMVLAAFANGTSRFDGIGELRVKESDRIQKMQELLEQCAIPVRSGPDWVEIDGKGDVFGPVTTRTIAAFDAAGDHRIAMCAMVLGMGGFCAITLKDATSIATSYPSFTEHMQHLGANISTVPRRPIVIAIDGPMAAGKGTLARKLAEHLDMPYLDTGLLYRATARAALDKNIALDDEAALADLARHLCLPIQNLDALRTAAIGAAASKVAAMPQVRGALLVVQQQFAAGPNGAVLDGRDIGTKVCPGADIKLWITASPEVRAERRRQELAQNGQDISLVEMMQQLHERDARDAKRKEAPMQMAADAHLIDTSKLRIDAALQLAQTWVERKLAERK